MKLQEIKLPPTEYLEELDEITDVRILNGDHRILHIWHKDASIRPKSWTLALIKRVHNKVVTRLEFLFRERGSEYQHKTPIKASDASTAKLNRVLMPIRPSGNSPQGEMVVTEEFLQHIKPFKIKADFVKLVGSLAVHGETEGDFDILIEPITGELLKKITEFRFFRGFPEELAERLSFLPQDTWKGPFTDFISLGELYFIPKLEFQKVEMQMRAAPKEIKDQAEESKQRDSISINRMFYPMKPTRGAYEEEYQTIENFLKLFKGKSFPRLTSKKFDGNTFLFFKNGDKVTITSDDGLDNTKQLPLLAKLVKKLNPTSMIFLAEIELWIDGVHYPRESIRSALSTKFDEWNKFLTANIFELVYINGRDLHNFLAPKRHSIATIVFKSLQSTDKIPEPGLNFIPQHMVRTPAQLKIITESLSEQPGSEGIVVKKGDYSLSGSASLDQAAKYHKAAWVNAIILKKIETKAEGIFVYEYGLSHDDRMKLTPPGETTKGIVPVGKTFNTILEGKQGDLIQIEFETLNFIKHPEKDGYEISLWIPTVITISPEGNPDTTFEAIEKAEQAGILQNKWIIGDDIFYDEAKVPEAMLKEARHCMNCKQPPFYEVLWAEGRAHAWFCKAHFQKWAKNSIEKCIADGYSANCEIDCVKEIEGKEVAKKFSQNKNPDIWQKLFSEFCSELKIKESVKCFIASFLEHKEELWELQSKLDLPKNHSAGEEGLHLTIALFGGIEDVEIIEQIREELNIPPFTFTGTSLDLFGENKDTVVLVGSIPEEVEKQIESLREKFGMETIHDFVSHITLGAVQLETKLPLVLDEPIEIFMSPPVFIIPQKQEQFQAKDPYMSYPEHGKKTNVMRHLHARGKSVHFDNRRELVPGEKLIGWTENVQKEGVIKKDIDTIKEAEEIFEGYSTEKGNKYLKPLTVDSKIVVEEKSVEPQEWLTFQGVTPEGTVGATKEHEGVLLIVDKGKTEWGAQKSTYHEYFDTDGKVFNGRYVVRQLKDIWGITKFKTVWLAWYAKHPLPYVISTRAEHKKWMPPDGQSALPQVIRDAIPSKYHYWKKKGKEAHELRDKLVKDKIIHKDNLGFNKKGEIVVKQKAAEEKVVPFRLLHRSWKGQQVIRFDRKGHDWIIMIEGIDDNDSKVTAFHLSRSPLVEKEISAIMEIEDKEFFDFEGEIPAEHPINPLQELPIKQEILDRGKVAIFEDSDDFKKVEFKGEKLRGLWIFRKENGGIWAVERPIPIGVNLDCN